MKTQNSLSLALAIASASLVGFSPMSAQAEDLGTAVPKGISAMKSKDWAGAQQIFTSIVNEHGAEAGEIGGKFGLIYFLKGNAEIQLAADFKKKGDQGQAENYYGLAKDSFAQCYAVGNADGKNTNQVRSLLMKGQAQQQISDYQGAVDSYQKFLKERGTGDKYSPGMLNINIAVCHFKQQHPKIKEGLTFLEAALKNKVRWKVSDGAVVAAVRALAEAVIVSKNEQALVDFLNQNRSAITLKPHQMVQYTPFYQKLASDALQADLPNAAFNLFALVPGTHVALSDLQSIQEKLKNYPQKGLRDGSDLISKAAIDKNLANLTQKVQDGDPPEVVALASLAYLHQSNGNLRGAFAAYQQLEMYFKKSSRREQNLFALIQMANQLGYSDLTVEYVKEFEKIDGVDSEKASKAVAIMLDTLFRSGKYAELEKLAAKTRKGAADKPEVDDIALYFEGASKFYQGKYKEAAPLLKEHLEKYPESKTNIATAYFEASNLGKLQKYPQAAASLDNFIAKHPDATKNAYLQYALLDRAEIAYNLQDDKKVLEIVGRITKDFPNSGVADGVLLIRGKVEQEAGETAKAVGSYKEALKIAEANGNEYAASEALYLLVVVLGAEELDGKPNPNLKDALPFYEQFWKSYPDSPFAAQAAVAGMSALVEAGRGEEGLKNLRETIVKKANSANPIGLDRVINSYSKFYLANEASKGVSAMDAANKLKQHYYDLPVDRKNVRSRALLMFAILGVYQEGHSAAVAAQDDALAKENQNQINALFKLIQSDFPAEKLSNNILMNLADYLRKNSLTPKAALPYYEERLKRPNKKDHLAARVGIADVKGRSSSKAEMAEAIRDLKKIVKETSSKKDADSRKATSRALNRIIAIHIKREDYDSAIKDALAYLESGDQMFRSEAQMALAKSYDAKKDYVNAIKYYNTVANARASAAEIGMPAMDRATELMWSHGRSSGEKSRQQVAYEVAAPYINNSRAFFEKNKSELAPEAREAWLNIEKRVQQWEKSGQIKTLAQLAAEKA